MATEVIMPRLGEGVIEGLIAKWLKQEGETVGQYEPLLEIETDKVTTEATAETAGTVLRILVPEGATVAVGTVLAYLGQPGEALPGDLATPAGAPPTAAPAPAARTHTNGGHTALPEVPAGQASRQAFPTRVSPVVARMAAEHAIDLSQIDGTGRGGRITKNDVLAYLEEAAGRIDAVYPGRALGRMKEIARYIGRAVPDELAFQREALRSPDLPALLDVARRRLAHLPADGLGRARGGQRRRAVSPKRGRVSGGDRQRSAVAVARPLTCSSNQSSQRPTKSIWCARSRRPWPSRG